LTSKERGWTIGWVGVRERPATRPSRAERRQSGSLAARINIVPSADRQSETVPRRRNDAARPDFDVQLVYGARRERLLLVVGMVGAPGRAELLVELAVRGAQPPLGNGSVGVERSLEDDFLEVWREQPDDEEEVSIFGFGRYEQLGRHWPGHLSGLLQRRRREGHAVRKAAVGHARRFRRFSLRHRQLPGVQVHLRPLSRRERP